jgi:hypothetical protein
MTRGHIGSNIGKRRRRIWGRSRRRQWYRSRGRKRRKNEEQEEVVQDIRRMSRQITSRPAGYCRGARIRDPGQAGGGRGADTRSRSVEQEEEMEVTEKE